MVTILIVLCVLMLLGAIPTWPHSRSWGYGPSGGLGLIVIILIILLLLGRILSLWIAPFKTRKSTGDHDDSNSHKYLRNGHSALGRFRHRQRTLGKLWRHA